MTLKEIYDSLPSKSDKGDVHSYVSAYDEILRPYRETAKNILEIGVLGGDSILMWEKYFTGEVYGVDCTVYPLGKYDLSELMKSHNILIFDSTDEQEVKRHFHGKQFDVIIEDAEHMIEQQLRLYEVFKPYLSPNGIYIIEDIQDIDKNENIFKNIDKEKKVEIIDRRKVLNRYDDVLVLIR